MRTQVSTQEELARVVAVEAPQMVRRWLADRPLQSQDVLRRRGWRWWEDIDISDREVNFYVFRPGAKRCSSARI